MNCSIRVSVKVLGECTQRLTAEARTLQAPRALPKFSSTSLNSSAERLWSVRFSLALHRRAPHALLNKPPAKKLNLLPGHALRNDWAALQLTHPPALTRDTSAWGQTRFGYRRLPSLKFMCKVHLQVDVQDSAHSPVEDSRACLQL